MKQLNEVPSPEIPDICPSSDHWINMLIDGHCFTCREVWGLSPKAEFGGAFSDEEDERPHEEPPADDEIENMARSAHEEYITAH